MTLHSTKVGLAEVLDHLLGRGAVVRGRTTISLAGIDLVHVELSLLLSSVETLRQTQPEFARRVVTASAMAVGAVPAVPRSTGTGAVVTPPLVHEPAHGFTGREGEPEPASPATVERDEQAGTVGPEVGLAQLVLVVVDLLRQVIERQALRRVEGGGLSEEEIERVGLALLHLDAKMTELKELFDMREDQLELDLVLSGAGG